MVLVRGSVQSVVSSQDKGVGVCGDLAAGLWARMNVPSCYHEAAWGHWTSTTGTWLTCNISIINRQMQRWTWNSMELDEWYANNTEPFKQNSTSVGNKKYKKRKKKRKRMSNKYLTINVTVCHKLFLFNVFCFFFFFFFAPFFFLRSYTQVS